MYLKHCAHLLVTWLTFCEMKPLKSISDDMEIIIKCNGTYPVSKRTLNMALIEKRFEDDVKFEFKCFLQCLYHKYEWMDNSGNFRYHTMKNELSESTLGDPMIEFLLRTCTDIDNKDKCEKAITFTKCFWAENAKMAQFTSSEWQWMNEN